jgi:hypothetical protein
MQKRPGWGRHEEARRKSPAVQLIVTHRQLYGSHEPLTARSRAGVQSSPSYAGGARCSAGRDAAVYARAAAQRGHRVPAVGSQAAWKRGLAGERDGAHYVHNEDDAGWDFSTPMTVTIAVADGPTVRLTYDGKWVRRLFLPHTRVEVRNQPMRPAPHWLRQLLGTVATLLLLYATSEKDWAPDLRAAAQQPPGTST